MLGGVQQPSLKEVSKQSAPSRYSITSVWLLNRGHGQPRSTIAALGDCMTHL